MLKPNRKKRKLTTTTAQSTSSVASSHLSTPRVNASFTRFFYQDDETDNTIAYCRLCTQELDELDGIQAQPYPYSKSGNSTGNLVKHLRERHNITSKNYKRYLDDNEQPIINRSVESTDLDLPSLSPAQQRELTKLVVEFIVYDGTNQLKELLLNINTVNLTTDLWTAKSNRSYLGVTVTWLTSEFKLQEALLTSHHMPYPHTGQNISKELFSVINKWGLVNKVHTIVTDNGANMVKSVSLLKENYLSNINWQSCVAHTLQLSVKEGLKQIKPIHKRLRSIQTDVENEDEMVNPLEVLTDSMLTLATSLRNKLDAASKREGEKLMKLCLTTEEQEYFAPKNDRGESFEAWVNLIYGSEDADTSNDSSLSSDNENTSNEMGLKASILDPWAIKLLPFATIPEREQTEAQIRAELLLLKTQLDDSNSNENIERSSVILNEVTLNEDPQDSLSAELWGSCSIPDHVFTENEFTRYMKEQIAHKNQNPLIWWEKR
ncbi:17172_t:CDS:2, partial [Cetraspora pellucida]